MNKKNGLIAVVALIIAFILIFWGNRLNETSTFPRMMFIVVLLLLAHYLLYVLVKKMPNPKTIYLFLLTFLFGLITIIFMIPFVINLIHSSNSEGGFNEDYSGLFVMIAGAITLLSFIISYIFKRKIMQSKS